MAKLEFDPGEMDGIVARISALGAGADDIMREAVHAGAEVAVELMREAVPMSTKHREHLRDHIAIGREGYDATGGYFCEVYPDGTRPGGGKASGRRYATIGYVLEYGRSNMAARPWMRPALAKGEGKIREAMEAVLKAHMEDQ